MSRNLTSQSVETLFNGCGNRGSRFYIEPAHYQLNFVAKAVEEANRLGRIGFEITEVNLSYDDDNLVVKAAGKWNLKKKNDDE